MGIAHCVSCAQETCEMRHMGIEDGFSRHLGFSHSNMADNREQILHYQRRLQKEGKQPDKVLHILQRLKQCSMTLELLQETGIGKTVNKVRKLDGEAGEKAKSLIKEWKQLIAAKGIPTKATTSTSSCCNIREERYPVPSTPMKKNPSWDDRNSPRTSGSKRGRTVEREDSYNVVDDQGSDDDDDGHDDIDHHMSQMSEERQRNTLQHLYPSTYASYAANAKLGAPSSSNYSHGTGETPRDKKVNDPPPPAHQHHHHHKGKVEQQKQNAHMRKEHERNSRNPDPNGLSKTSGERKKRVESSEGFDATTFSFEQCLGLNDRKSSKKKRSGGSPNVASQSKNTSPQESHHEVAGYAVTSGATGPGTGAGRVRKAREKKKDTASPDSDNLPGPLKSNEWKSTAPPLKLSWNDVDVDATLPSIQPNYRPLRLGIPDSPPRKKQRALEVDSATFISSKNTRTQVFSGRRVVLTEVPTLYEACIRVLQDNVKSLDFLDGVPYFILKPVLALCNSKQLYNLEDLNPYLLDDTDELWKILSQRQYKSQVPDEMESWREMFLRLDDERDKKLKSTTANIKVTMAKADPVRKTLLAEIAKPPRNIARKQAKFGTGQSQSSLNVSAPKRNSSSPTPAKVSLGLTKHVARSSETPAPSQPAKVVKKVAPLMQRTLKLMKNIRR